jgi:general secretion pathway protein I
VSGSDQGSVFIEALVACAVVAGVLAALFDVIQASAERRSGLEARREALMIARSELASVGEEVSVAPGQVEGVEGAYQWRIQIDQPLAQALAISHAGPLYPVRVSVTAARGGQELVVLKTLRIGVPP